MKPIHHALSSESHFSFPTLETWPEKLETHLWNGEQGTNRERQRACQIRANNDLEAIRSWLNEYRHKPTTFRLYQKEGERFFLWSIFERKKPISSLDVDDFKAYFLFLENPTPKSRWCSQDGGRGHKRGSKQWRPFVGPLNSATRATAITVVNSLITYLVDAQYLAYHPLKLIRKKQASFQNPLVRKMQIKKRILEQDEWETMQEVLENWPAATPHERDEKERLRFLVRILFFLGLRVNELVTHTWGAFQKEEGLWWFYVLGKGSKLAKIPVNDEFMSDVKRFRTHLRYTAEPQANEPGALIPSWRSKESIKDRYVNKLLKKLALKTAEKFKDQPEKCEKIKRFSPHWLRHLSATQQDRAGISLTDIRDNCRHENEATTRLYVHALDRARHEAMRKLSFSRTHEE